LLYEVYQLAKIRKPEETIEALKSEIFSVKNIVNIETQKEILFKNTEKELLEVQFSKHILDGKTTPADWNNYIIETALFIKDVSLKISKNNKEYLLINIDTLDGDKTVFLFDNLEELSSKIVAGGIRLFRISRKNTIRGPMFTLLNCKYYREKEE
jgi:predicted AAA+ superfamily ATPase